MKCINKIINESINKFLLEREMKNSVPGNKIIELIKKYNFITPKYNTNTSRITAYYNPQIQKSDNNQIQLNSDFNKVNNIVTKGGWTITNYGNHYNGMRDRYKTLQQYDNNISIGTFIINIEPEYSTKMDNYFNDEYFNDEYNIPSEHETFYTNYQKGIFYHITKVKYLKKILAHGLRPKNGGGITRWRETSERLYLSLYPNFSEICEDVDVNNLDEYDEDEQVMLKIDLTKVMNNFDFYVDHLYDNAVYTYANIPPQFITVMNFSKYEKEYLLKYCALTSLKNTIEKSFNTKDKTKIISFCKENYQSLLRVVTHNAINLMNERYYNIKYNEDELISKIKETIKDFLNEK